MPAPPCRHSRVGGNLAPIGRATARTRLRRLEAARRAPASEGQVQLDYRAGGAVGDGGRPRSAIHPKLRRPAAVGAGRRYGEVVPSVCDGDPRIPYVGQPRFAYFDAQAHSLGRGRSARRQRAVIENREKRDRSRVARRSGNGSRRRRRGGGRSAGDEGRRDELVERNRHRRRRREGRRCVGDEGRRKELIEWNRHGRRRRGCRRSAGNEGRREQLVERNRHRRRGARSGGRRGRGGR